VSAERAIAEIRAATLYRVVCESLHSSVAHVSVHSVLTQTLPAVAVLTPQLRVYTVVPPAVAVCFWHVVQFWWVTPAESFMNPAPDPQPCDVTLVHT
jgi:hypothetical protein